jgi:hypothetical protein
VVDPRLSAARPYVESGTKKLKKSEIYYGAEDTEFRNDDVAVGDCSSLRGTPITRRTKESSHGVANSRQLCGRAKG